MSPCYDWFCEKCKWSVEMLGVQPETVECPKCAGEMKRLFPRSSFRLIGKGWSKKDG